MKIKQYIVLIFFVSLTSTMLKAQSFDVDTTKKVRKIYKTINYFNYGVNGGLFMGGVNFYDKSGFNTAFYPRMQGGVNALFKNKFWSGVQLELNYKQKGWKQRYDNGDEFTVSLNYIEVPLLTHFEVGEKWRIRPMLNAGPFVAFMLDKKITDDITDASQRLPYQDAEIDNTFEFGLIAAIGAIANFDNLAASLEFRFNQTWTHIYDQSVMSFSQNQIYGLCLTVYFKGNK
ncbi:MAG: porin family protein [Bacteroidales bacterium]